MKVWVVSAKSESGDDYGPWVFKTPPSTEKLEAFLREECSGDFPEPDEDEGPGDYGSYIHVEGPHESEVIEL